jgi:hypothetical protein
MFASSRRCRRRCERGRSERRVRSKHIASRPSSVASPTAPPPPPPPDAAAAVTESVTEVDGEVPAAFEQASAYVSVPTAVGLTVWEPLVAKAPDQLPDEVQPEAFEEDQVIVVDAPLTMVFEARVNVGAAGGGPVTVSVSDVACELPAEFAHTIV